jgi:homoserine O-succinyltransferase
MNGIDMGAAAPRATTADRPLTIGLVNNMPAGARSSTERQFRKLLAAAVGDQAVRLRHFSSEPARLAGDCSEIEALYDTELDAIIVTGAEPQSESLRDEPLWPRITRLVDWAESHGIPAIWSCLAAHAVVLYLDGIDREPFGEKLSGLFASEIAAHEHRMMQGLAAPCAMPHSRCNDLPEKALQAHGYTVLVRSDEAGVGVFHKQTNASFLFFQCHPEYEADTLLREYQRDVRRYQLGERLSFPAAPRHYLQPEAGAILRQLQALGSAVGWSGEDMSSSLGLSAYSPLCAAWLPISAGLVRNWVADVLRRRASMCQPAWIFDSLMKPIEMGRVP